MQLYEMDTFVASCRTPETALELARFMERKFPMDSKVHGPQIHKFIVVVDTDGEVEVHSTVAVNDLGRIDFKRFVTEFVSLKMRKPVQRAVLSDRLERRLA